MTQVIKSVCQMCGTAYSGCGIDVYVEKGKVVKIEGTKGHPVNDGTLCPKGLAAIQMLYNPERILYPMKRLGGRGEGKWQQISWDEAMDTVVTKLNGVIEADGARAITWIKGQGPGWQAAWDYCQRFMNLIGSPNLVQHGHNCHFGRGAGHAFTYGWMPDPDYENANLIMLWGYNPVNTGMPHAVRIMKAKERGAKLVVIDPRFSKTAAKADMFVQVRPGSDGALALGMLNVIIGENLYDKGFVDKWVYGFDKLAELVKNYPPEKVEEITWVPAKTIRQIARMFANIKPACLHESNGLDQMPNVAQTTRAVAILRVITGNLNEPGGSILDPDAWPFFMKRRYMDARKKADEDIHAAFGNSVSKHPLFFALGYCGVPDIVDAILTDKPFPIKAAIVQGMNPAVISSNSTKVREALKKVPFLAVFGINMDPTAQLADIVLPAATFLERNQLIEWWFGSKPRVDGIYYQLQRKVEEPLGESKSDYDFISDLARRMGHEDEWPWKTVEEYINWELEPVGITYQELVDHPEDVVKGRHTPKYLYETAKEKYLSLPFFPHHKVAFYSDLLGKSGYDPLPTYVEPAETPMSSPDLLKKYPLVCMACIKPGLFVHSQYRTLPWLKEIMPEPFVEIHSEKAKELGIKDGDTVTVKSPRSSIDLKARVCDSLDPRVVGITHGWWKPATNFLTPNEYRCPITGATSNRCFLVNVTKKKGRR